MLPHAVTRDSGSQRRHLTQRSACIMQLELRLRALMLTHDAETSQRT